MCRVTFATLLISAGAHPKYIQAQLGHASMTVTMDMYGHRFPGTFAKLVTALDDASGRNPAATAPDPSQELSRAAYL
jgi:integrase